MSLVESGQVKKGIGEIIPEALKGATADRASVIMARTTTKYYPNGAQTIRSDQNRTLQFRLASSEMLDPMTAYLNLRVLAHHPKTHMEDYVHSIIQKAVLKIGGVECENVDRVDLCHKLMAYASSPQQYYQHTAAVMQGAWKFAPRHGMQVTVDDNANGPLQANSDRVTNAAGGLYHDNSYGHFPETNPLWNQGHTSEADYNANNTTTSLGDRSVGYGTHFAIPLSEIFGFFKTTKYVPTFVLGAIDIEITFNPYSACMFEGKLSRVTANGAIQAEVSAQAPGLDGAARGAETAVVPDALRVYEVRDIAINIDTCAADPTYSMIVQQMASQSETGLELPFTSMVSQQKTISNAGKNTISINRGVSFLRSVIVGMRPVVYVNEPTRQKSSFYYADTFKSFAMSIGNKRYPQNPITSTTQSYEELLKGFGLHNNIHSGSVLTPERYKGKVDPLRSFQAGGVVYDHNLMSLTSAGTPLATAALFDAVRQYNQLFLLGLNTEKVLQSNVLSGVNLRMSGFNIVLDVELQTKSEAVAELRGRHHIKADEKELAARHKPSYAFYDYDIEVTTVMLIDKAISIRADQVSVAE